MIAQPGHNVGYTRENAAVSMLHVLMLLFPDGVLNVHVVVDCVQQIVLLVILKDVGF